jgi:hypothetical protein
MKPPEESAWVRFRELPFLTAFSGYILLYALLISKGVYVRGDDFAYLESVTGSLARGSLYTHDFIGPRNAFLTALGAAIYALTGNFYLSTLGALPLFACANFLLLYAIFRHRLPPWQAAAWTGFTATFPFYLHKSLDYHGTLPTLTCFLTALLAFRSGRHGLFFLAAGLAVSTRQNSLVLFALPLFALAEGFRKGGAIDRRPLYYCAATLAALAALRLHMNVNWFSRNLHVLPSDPVLALKIARQFGVGLFLELFFLSLAGLALGSASPMALLRENLRRFAFPAGATLAFALLAFASPAALVWFQTPLIGSFDHGGRLQILLAACIIVSLWFLDRRLLRPDAYILLGVAYAGISCLLGFFWDYYLAEPALLAVWIVLRARRDPLEPDEPPLAFPRGLPFLPAPAPTGAARAFSFPLPLKLFLAAALAGNLAYAYLYKVQMDKNALSVIAFEGLERKGRLTPERMSGATFGFLGFKLFSLIAEDHPDHSQDDFTCYVQADGAVVESALPWSRVLRPARDPAALVLDSGFHSIGYMRLPYRVVDYGNPGGNDICHRPYRPDPRTQSRSRRYPLDNAEWRRFIAERR